MKMSKGKILALVLLTVIMLFSILQIHSLAASKEMLVLKQSDNQYIIYIQDLLNKKFEFAFSNTEDATNLNYITYAKDSEGNNIAYVDQELKDNFFNSENTYIWVKTEDKIIINGEKIKINNAKTVEQLKTIENLTKNITINSSAEDEKITVNGEQGKKYYYKIVEVGTSETYNELFNVVNVINNFNDKTDTFTKLQRYNELYNLYNVLATNISNEDWTEVKDLQITKPYGAKEDSQYILWLKDSEGNIDVQLLTAYEKEITLTEEVEKTEKITTALPVTYDNTTVLFIALGTVIALIIAVVVYKKIKSRK